ncbi:site-specific integrase [Rhizobium sp. Root483D2]|uniref:tyrosine-type recombinase/integrase n=1 Tax=Rhizobium sp. Root483D2 TaxID=1736545 RepID=UPI0007154836|nr:site-specific integrase [Rhizobium sp. Root483D2]KQY20804.1 integrase [Rhizobium sp. Root483D2]
MGTITERKRANGSKSYTAQIRIKRDGKIAHSEAQTFERRPAANAWLKKRENELSAPGALSTGKNPNITLADAIDRYVSESQKSYGKTKAQVLKSIKDFQIASMKCRDIGSADIVEFAQELGDGRQPQTVGNYLSHLSTIFAIAKPAWGIELNYTAMLDAQKVLKRLGTAGRSKERDRRPTIEELDKILAHYEDRQIRVPTMAPMSSIILFALFSTRRQDEVCRITWSDLDVEHGRVLVRDMKNPGEKIGNHVWCDLVPEALAVLKAVPHQNDDRIFPYEAKSVSTSFTRACSLLDIDDLHFHDLRHEGISRLFELGWSIPHVATVSGHRSWNSLKRYAHLKSRDIDKYVNWARRPPCKE